MSGKTNLTLTTFSGKKLLSRAHTSLAATDSEETASSAVQLSAETIFGDAIPDNPSKTLNTVIDGSVEYVEFDITPINESFFDANDFDGDASAQSAGHHSYIFSLKNSYETDTDNAKAGTGAFKNGQHLTGTLGGLQIISPAFSTSNPNPFICTIYSGSRDLEDQINLTDQIDWYVDYYSGILYVQDYDASKIPTRAKAFIYVGNMVSSRIGGGSGTGVGWIASGNGGISTTGSLFLGTNSAVGSNSDIFFSNTGEARFNEQGLNSDFNIKSVNKSSAFKVDADQNKVLVLSGGADSSFNESEGLDVSFYVSGSTSGKDSSSGGVAVFGGDVVFSGSLYDKDGNLITAGGGGGSPGGNNTNIQFNDGGSFGGSSAFTFTGTEVELNAASPKYTLRRSSNTEESSLTFEGSSGVPGASVAHGAVGNDLVFKTFGNGGASLEEMLRLGGYSSGDNRQVIFLSGSGVAASDMQPSQSSDIAFFVSGAIGSRASSNPGSAVFGGDTVISGSVHALDKIYLQGSSTSQNGLIESYDTNGSVILSASNGDIKLDAGSGVWHFEEDGSEQLKIETSPDSNDIKFVKTNDNGQFYFNIESGGSEISALQASTDGTRGKVGINFQSGGPTNLLDIKADSNDQGFTVRNSANKPVVQFSLENVNYGRLIFQDETSVGITQIGSRPGMDHYFHASGSTNFGIGTRTPGHLLDVRSDNNAEQIFLLSGSGGSSSANEKDYTDLSFFVSGSIGSKGSSNKGTALFGGDLVVSGTIFNGAGVPIDGGVNFTGGLGSNNQMITADGSGNIVAETNISFNGSQLEVTGSILPGLDKAYDLGGPNNRFANIYTGDLHLRNERGHWQIVEESDALTVINRLTGKRYKMVLEPYEENITGSIELL